MAKHFRKSKVIIASYACKNELKKLIRLTFLPNFSARSSVNLDPKPNMESDVEMLCRAIYDNGEQYMDGTGAIAFSKLKQVSFNKNKSICETVKKALN